MVWVFFVGWLGLFGFLGWGVFLFVFLGLFLFRLLLLRKDAGLEPLKLSFLDTKQDVARQLQGNFPHSAAFWCDKVVGAF